MSLAAFDALDESERALWVAKDERSREKCGRCGLPRSVCGDPDRPHFPQRTVCYATMEQAAAQAKWERLHEKRPWHDGSFTHWAEKPSDSHPYHHSHGVTIWVADQDLSPDDDFLAPASLNRADEPEGGDAQDQ